MADSGIFESAALRKLLEDHLEGRRDHAASLWAIMMFERFLAHEGTQAASFKAENRPQGNAGARSQKVS